MRTRNNGFVKFMCKLDGKEFKPVKAFTHKEEWPGACTPENFRELVYRVTENYTSDSVLSAEDRNLLDRAITWDSSAFEEEFVSIHAGYPIPDLIYDVFQNWRWRLENGEEPQSYNDEEDLEALPW